MVRVGSWNVENLFLPGGPSGPQTEEAYAATLDALAAMITALAPDVLAVQEIGAPEAMGGLVARLDGDWHVALADPDDRDIRVGYLSRLPLTSVEQVSTFPEGLRPIQFDDTDAVLSAMGRPALQARVDVSAARSIADVSPEVQASGLSQRPVLDQRRGRAGQVRGVRGQPACGRGRHRP